MFFGHGIKKDGIVVDVTKIEAVTNWTNVLKVRSFLGLPGY